MHGIGDRGVERKELNERADESQGPVLGKVFQAKKERCWARLSLGKYRAWNAQGFWELSILGIVTVGNGHIEFDLRRLIFNHESVPVEIVTLLTIRKQFTKLVFINLC